MVSVDNPAMRQLMRPDSMAPYPGHFLHSPQTPRLAPWAPPPGDQRSKVKVTKGQSNQTRGGKGLERRSTWSGHLQHYKDKEHNRNSYTICVAMATTGNSVTNILPSFVVLLLVWHEKT